MISFHGQRSQVQVLGCSSGFRSGVKVALRRVIRRKNQMFQDQSQRRFACFVFFATAVAVALTVSGCGGATHRNLPEAQTEPTSEAAPLVPVVDSVQKPMEPPKIEKPKEEVKKNDPVIKPVEPVTPEKLGFHFVDEDPDRVDVKLRRSTRLIDDAEIRGNEVLFKYPVRPGDLNLGLNSGRPIFLTWSEEGLQTRLTQATFRITEGRDEFEQRPVGKEMKAQIHMQTRAASIPLEEALGRALQDTDLSLEHQVHLNLEMEDRSRAQFLIRFRADGPLPSLIREELPLPGISDPAQYLQTISRGGFPLMREKISNPSYKSVRLLLSVPNEGDVVEKTTFAYTGGNEMQGVYLRRFHSEGHFGLKRVRVTSHLGESVEISLSPGVNRSVELPPRSGFQLEWLAMPKDSSPNCGIGSPITPAMLRKSFDQACQERNTVLCLLDLWFLEDFDVAGDATRAIAMESVAGVPIENDLRQRQSFYESKIEAHESATLRRLNYPYGAIKEDEPFHCQGVF